MSNRIHPYFVQTTRSVPASSEGRVCTDNLPNGHWVDTAHLQPGDLQLNNDDTWAEVVGVEAKPFNAYNLTAADFHTYFVAANTNAAPVWVHNAPCVPGRVKSRIDLATGDSGSGWTHVVDRHFNPDKNASQFTVSQGDLRIMLQSPKVVNTPITRTAESAKHGTLYVREVALDLPIGTDKFYGFQPTSILTVTMDKYG